MSFYTSLTGLKGAQTDLATISNNVANAGSTGFKRSRAMFGDLFAHTPMQAAGMVAGNGTHLLGIKQQFTQGAVETTDRTLDLAIAGDGFFAVRGAAPRNELAYTRAGAFQVTPDRAVVDATGARLQLLPVDTAGRITATGAGDLMDFNLPAADPADPGAPLANLTISAEGVVTATYANGTQQALGAVAMASFTAVEGLRQTGNAHWQATGTSGAALFGQAGTGPLGAVQSGGLERANIDITEELVALIGAQRNFQANAQAIETANAMTQTIVNLQV